MNQADNEREAVGEVETTQLSPEAATDLAVSADILPTTLVILPLTERPFLPVQTMPVSFPEKPWLASLQQVGESAQHLVGLVKVPAEIDLDALSVDDFSAIGTATRVHQAQRDNDAVQFIGEGINAHAHCALAQARRTVRRTKLST